MTLHYFLAVRRCRGRLVVSRERWGSPLVLSHHRLHRGGRWLAAARLFLRGKAPLIPHNTYTLCARLWYNSCNWAFVDMHDVFSALRTRIKTDLSVLQSSLLSAFVNQHLPEPWLTDGFEVVYFKLDSCALMYRVQYFLVYLRRLLHRATAIVEICTRLPTSSKA